MVVGPAADGRERGCRGGYPCLESRSVSSNGRRTGSCAIPDSRACGGTSTPPTWCGKCPEGTGVAAVARGTRPGGIHDLGTGAPDQESRLQAFPQFPRRPVTTNASRLAEGFELLPDIARIDADNQTKIRPCP